MSVSSRSALTGESPLSERPAALVRVFGIEPLHTDGELLALGFAADGTLWSVEDPGVLRHWDPAAGRALGWRSLDDLATLWTFAPGCRWAASGSDELSLWDVAGGDLAAVFSPPSWVTSLAFSTDGRLLASGHDDGSVRLWDTLSRRMLRELRSHHKPISALAFSPDGKSLASAGEDKVILIWDLSDGTVRTTLLGHTDRVPALVWHPKLPRLISAGWDTTARVWDAVTGEPIILLNSHANQVHALAINADGSLLASADSANAIHIWSLAQNRTLRVWTDQGAEVRCLAFAPDGETLASGGSDRVLRVRNARKDETPPVPPNPLESRTCLALSPDGSRLYSLAAGGRAHVWQAATAQPAIELKEAGPLRAFALSPDGSWLAGSLSVEVPEELRRHGKASGIASLYLWDAKTGQRRALLEGQAPPITALAFSADSKTLASASYTRSDAWLWDVASAKPLLLIPSALEGCSVESLAFQPQGQFLAVGGIDWMATGGSDGAVALWNLARRALLTRFGNGTAALAIHPGGQRLATAGLNQSVQVWEVPAGKLLAELEGHADAVTCVAYSPDSRWLASGSDDHTVCLWDAANDTLAARTQLDTQVKALSFAPDGASLFTGNGNGSCYQLSVSKLFSF
jgi:WD40 repeat protein